jgi:porphobilinogen deaminase
MLIRLGSRGSRLALTQAERAAERLRESDPDLDVALVPITTAGDRDRSKPFGEIGERGVFVKEIEEALLAGRIDVAVHSAKDMTSTLVEGLAVGAYLPRDDPSDALCGVEGLRPGLRIGTASVRRKAQLLALEPGLSVEPLRGNVDTRLRKMRERGLDAIVLAAAGPIGWAFRARSAAGSTSTSSCRKLGRAPSRFRSARARRISSRRRTTARRAGGSRPSALASHGSGPAALRPSPRTTTGVASLR